MILISLGSHYHFTECSTFEIRLPTFASPSTNLFYPCRRLIHSKTLIDASGSVVHSSSYFPSLLSNLITWSWWNAVWDSPSPLWYIFISSHVVKKLPKLKFFPHLVVLSSQNYFFSVLTVEQIFVCPVTVQQIFQQL